MTTNAKQDAPTAEETKKPEPTGSATAAASTQKDSSPKPAETKPAETKPAEATKPAVKPEEKKEDPKPAATTAPAAAAPAAAKKEEETPAVEEKLPFNREKYAQFKLVRMYLKQKGTVQYDPAFPELVLRSADKENGQLLPLTPFFKSRIGTTLEVIGME